MCKYFPAILVITGFLSCKKTDINNNNCVLNSTTIVGVYKVTAKTYQASSGSPISDLLNNLPPCEKDNTIELGADGSLTFTDAGINCGIPPEPGSANGWELVNGNTLLKIGDEDFNVKSFNCKELVLIRSSVFITGDSETRTMEKL